MRKELKSEVSEILEILGDNLDISKSQYEAAVTSYTAVANYLARENSPFNRFHPRIVPQGSFMLGTIIKSICEEDDIDIDLVLLLEGKYAFWSQKDFKDAVGDDIKKHGTYGPMIKDRDGGRRCWTLEYADSANYHMDILPAVGKANYKTLTETYRFSDDTVTELALSITDKERVDYDSETNTDLWLASNPLGYAQWFFSRAVTRTRKMMTLNEAVDPVRSYEAKRTPLQRVVQLLKRHRDIMFSSDEYNSDNKPISIIITTLAAKCYSHTEDIVETLSDVVGKMRGEIRDEYNSETGKYEKYVRNPVNPSENFADKWPETPQKQEYFYAWLDKLEEDLADLQSIEGKGIPYLNESLSRQFGADLTRKTFSELGRKTAASRDAGNLKMAAGTGILGNVGMAVKPHNFEGIE